MTFIQIVRAEPDAGISGANLRNTANYNGIARRLGGSTDPVSVTPLSEVWSETPTVLALGSDEIDRVLDIIASRKPEVVLVEGVALLDAARAIRAAFPEVTIIADYHNVESALWRDIHTGRLPRLLRALTSRRARRRHAAARAADIAFAELADAVWVCSQDDADRLGAMAPRAAISVVPNPQPDWCAGFSAAPDPRDRQVLFLGHLGYRPNRKAVAELCRRIMPRLQRTVPAARLVVAGRRPRPRVAQQVAAAGHRLVADPTDLRPIYAATSVVAVPLRTGGGTRIKVIEALSLGCPLVATTKAVEGLGLEPGLHYLPAESPAAFAAALARVLSDDAVHARLASAGRDLAARRFGPEAHQEAVDAALAGTVHLPAGT